MLQVRDEGAAKSGHCLLFCWHNRILFFPVGLFLMFSMLWLKSGLSHAQPILQDGEIDELCTLVFASGVVLEDVPLAKTIAQQARGLTGRDDAGAGMLFSWEMAAPRMFWMRDTRIHLSIGFMDAQGWLFSIQDMEAGSETYHESGRSITDALELARGGFAKHGLQVGDRLLERHCRPVAGH